MKIVICGSMTASREMVEAEKKLQEMGHEIVLPEFTHEYASMSTMDKMHTESAKNKIVLKIKRIKQIIYGHTNHPRRSHC